MQASPFLYHYVPYNESDSPWTWVSCQKKIRKWSLTYSQRLFYFIKVIRLSSNIHHHHHNHFICSVKCKNTVEKQKKNIHVCSCFSLRLSFICTFFRHLRSIITFRLFSKSEQLLPFFMLLLKGPVRWRGVTFGYLIYWLFFSVSFVSASAASCYVHTMVILINCKPFIIFF